MPPINLNNYAMPYQVLFKMGEPNCCEKEARCDQSLVQVPTEKNEQSRINSKPNLCDKIISAIKAIAKKIMQALQKLFSTIKNLFVDDENYDRDAQLEIQRLIPEIAEIKDKIKSLDNFIKSKPELEKKCLTYMERNPYLLKIPDKVTLEDFDPNNPIDQRAFLKIEKNHLEYLLNKRIRFMGYFPELYDLFGKCVLEEQKVNADFKHPLLLENIK